jgi:uncharacterized membrane protein
METPATTQTPARVAPLALSIILLGVVALVVVLFAAESVYSGWYALFKAVHVIFAVIWIGGGFVLTLLGIIAERKNDPNEIAVVARQAATVGLKVFAPAGLIVFLMGIAMMLNTNWGWGKFWIVAGLIGYATTFLTGLLVLDPLAKRIDASVQANGATHPETIALVKRILLIVRFDMALLFLVVADMVTKPFA